MNWLARISRLQLIVIAVFFFSCESGENLLDFDLNNNTNVELVTLTLSSQNIFIDSLRTDNESTIVAGRYQDSEFGAIEAEGYTELRYVDGRALVDSLTFDSLIFRLKVDSYLSNDLNDSISLVVSDLEGSISSTLVYLKEIQNESGFIIDTLDFRLDDEFDTLGIMANGLGRYLFNKMARDTVDVTNYSFVTDITFTSSASNQSAITINLASEDTELLLYSSYDTLSYETILRFTGQKHSYISSDFTSSALQNISDKELFDLPNGKQTVNSIFGIYNFVDLSPLQDLIETSDNILVNRAEISTPFLGTSSTENFGLRYYFYDPDHGFRGEGVFEDPFRTMIMSNDSYTRGTNESFVSILDTETSSYEGEVTFFVESYFNFYLTRDEFLTDGLVVTPSSFVSMKNSELSSNGSTILRLYLTKIN